MSDTTDTAPDPAAAAESSVPAEPTDDTSPNVAEARKYRKRAQEAETERDALRDRLTGMQRAEVERLAGQHLAAGADIWHDNPDLAALLDDTGLVDPARVSERVKEVLTVRPHWQKPTAAAESASSVRGNDRVEAKDTKGFADAFKPRNQR